MGRRIYFMRGTAVPEWRSEGAKFGRAWWYWRPRASWTGWPFKRGWLVADVSVSWLCFFWGFTFYRSPFPVDYPAADNAKP